MTVIAISFALGAVNAFSQATTGSISGDVVDKSGAAVPKASVKVTNTETGTERDTEGSDTGLFAVPRLTPGKYVVRVMAQGFRVSEFKDVSVLLGIDTHLDVVLEVGSISEVVTVEATAPLVESTTAQTTTTFETKKVVELPALTGRLDSIALLSPGVIPGFGNVNSNGATLSVNGQRARSNNFTIDGQDNNDNSIGGPGLFLSNIDVVKEFSIVTNNFSAEYGRNQGAIVNIVTKGGTNAIHGALYGYHQNSRFFANSFDNNRDKLPKPRFNDNIDGGTIGGPIVKDKVFYFVYLQSDQSRSVSNNTSGRSARVITPTGLATLLAACGATNTLAAYRDFGPFAQTIGSPKILSGSLGTSTVTGCGPSPVSFQTARITRTTATPFNQYDFGIKPDVNFGKNTINVRYLFQDGVNKNANGSSAGYEIDIPFRSQNMGATYTRQLTSRQVNEFRFNYGRLAVAFEGANTFKFKETGKNIARFVMPSGFLSFGLATNLPQNRFVNTYQFVDNWSIQVGRHFLKAGADIRRQLTPVGFLPQINGQFAFINISNFARNIPARFNGAAGDPNLKIKETDLFFYFQDDFKIRPNFTLNLGIRYEYTGQPLNVVHEITVARESNPSTAFFNPALPLSARTVPEIPTDKNNVAPRFGFAYTPRWGKWLFGEEKTVIRGGFSMAYDPAFFNLLLNVSTAAPTVLLYALSPVTVPTDVTGDNIRRVFAPPLRTQDPRLLNQTQFDKNFKSPYAENWTFGIQRQVRPTLAFEVRYAGSRGVGLYQSLNGNPNVRNFTSRGFGRFVPPGITPAPISGRVTDTFRVVRVRANTAASTYHGLQSRLDGRLFNQLTLGLSYTYSRNIDNVSEVFSFLGSGSFAFAQNPFDVNKGERGHSNIDLRHSLAWNFIWDIPAFKNQQGALGHILGGWTVSGIFRWTTGRPMTPFCFFCGQFVNDFPFANTFVGTFDTTRPFVSNPAAAVTAVGVFAGDGCTMVGVTGTEPICTMPPTTLVSLNALNTAANIATFVPTPINRNDVHFIVNGTQASSVFGTPFGIGRNTFRGPQFNRADFAFFKNTKIGERIMVQLRAEARNIFNTPFLGIPDLDVSDAGKTFMDRGASASGVFPRQITFGLRFTF